MHEHAKYNVNHLKGKIVLPLISIVLSGCTVFGGSSHEYNNPSAYEVARHNYNTSIGSMSYGRMYLLVNDKGEAKPRDLALYINQLLEPLGSNKITLQALVDYNKAILEHLKQD